MTEAMENDIIKKDLKIVERNNELMVSSEKREDNNYKDFYIYNMKKIITLKIDTFFPKIFVLQDAASSYFVIYNSKNNYLFIFDEKYIDDIIQMDDGIVIILAESEIKFLNIKEKNYETIMKSTILNAIKMLNSEKYGN